MCIRDSFMTVGEDTARFVTGIDTFITVFLDSVALSSPVPTYLLWWVTASSQDDQVDSYNRWRIALPPFSDVEENRNGLPKQFALQNAYPNPFNSTVTLKFAVPDRKFIAFEVFNTLGQRVAVIDRRVHDAGYHILTWDAGNYASGMYLVRMHAGEFRQVRKILLVK